MLTTIVALTALLHSPTTPDTLSLSSQNHPTRTAIDTLPTDDKYTKVVLYDNNTWEYIDLGRPVIDDTDFDTENWNTDKIHAYRDMPLSLIPDEVDLLLVDSLHSYHPPSIGTVTARYCFRRTREHNGTDLRLNIGDPIYAAFDGKVRVSKATSKTGGYGNLIVIRHANGLETYYGHLSEHAVKVDELVKAGEVIGYGGNTGRSTGPHLHFETRYQGQSFDPERIIDFSTGQLRDTLITLKKHYFSIYSHHGQTDAESLAASQRIVHRIKSGDTLSGLAVKYHTTVSKICKLNNMSPKTTLRIGQRVTVR